jgi:NAD dependent epimerase/dehydratase family enzyme
MILLGLDHTDKSGVLNGTAPQPVTNKTLTKSIGRALHRPSFMPTPRLMLRLMLGEVANVITTGQRVLPQRAIEWGYNFRFPEVDGALGDVLGG